MDKAHSPNQTVFERYIQTATLIHRAIPPDARVWYLWNLIHEMLKAQLGFWYSRDIFISACKMVKINNDIRAFALYVSLCNALRVKPLIIHRLLPS